MVRRESEGDEDVEKERKCFSVPFTWEEASASPHTPGPRDTPKSGMPACPGSWLIRLTALATTSDQSEFALLKSGQVSRRLLCTQRCRRDGLRRPKPGGHRGPFQGQAGRPLALQWHCPQRSPVLAEVTGPAVLWTRRRIWGLIKLQAGALGGRMAASLSWEGQPHTRTSPHLAGPADKWLLAEVSPSVALGASVSVRLLNATGWEPRGSPGRAGTQGFHWEACVDLELRAAASSQEPFYRVQEAPRLS